MVTSQIHNILMYIVRDDTLSFMISPMGEDEWMDDLQFYVFSKELQSYQDNERKIMKGCVPMEVWPQGYKTFFMLNSTEHEIFPAHKCYNANNCWHFNIYEWGK